MKRKIFALTLLLTLTASLFSCRQTPIEPATQLSNVDSAYIQEKLEELENKLSDAQNTIAANDISSFTEQLTDASAGILSYNGSDDVVIDNKNAADKTVKIDTTGSITLSAPVDSLIVAGAENGFTAKARAESILLEGDGITAEIKSETGTILVKGKNITVNLRNSATDNIIVVNNTAKINNITGDDIELTLANGTKITVPTRNTYNVSDNTLQKYKSS